MINEKNIGLKTQYLDKALRVGASFDVVRRDIISCGKKCSFYFIDGLTKDEVMLRIMDLFMKLKELAPSTLDDLKVFYDTYIPYVEVEDACDENKLITGVLSGMTAMVADGISGAVLIDCRTYPVRSIEEPENDKVLRGARVGFVETLIFNAALIRRHIRDVRLTMKIKTVGRSSKTDIVLCYLDGAADKTLLSKIEEKIDAINVPALSLGTESLAECLIEKRWYNPFPKIRYTERPDAAAASIMEGSIIVLCDNSPSVMILPTCIFDFLQETDDYYFPPLTGTYLRFVRCSVFFLTMFLSPLWYLLITHPEYIPPCLEFVKIASPSALPVIVQLFLLEFAVDGLKLAALNTPSVLAGSFSIIGGLILGDFAVKVGWFVPETILYTAFVSIANFAQPSYELGYAFKFMRMILLALTALFEIWGFIGGVVLSLVLIGTNKTVDGQRHYLYPLFPFNKKALYRLIFRQKLK